MLGKPMTGKTISKVKYRDYRGYPPEFMLAAKWRDQHIALPNVKFIVRADAEHMLARLLELGKWERDFTNE
jgi:hypothetical protein